MNAERLRRLAGRVAATMVEMNEAQRRMTILRFAQDRYLFEPHLPPEDYNEFLARTSGPLLREPSAQERNPGQRGCPR